jgi:hypothetical protein
LLRFFVTKLEIELRCDATFIGIAGILMQKHNNSFYPCGYYSRLTEDAETRYAIYDLEVLIAIESMQ